MVYSSALTQLPFSWLGPCHCRAGGPKMRSGAAKLAKVAVWQSTASRRPTAHRRPSAQPCQPEWHQVTSDPVCSPCSWAGTRTLPRPGSRRSRPRGPGSTRTWRRSPNGHCSHRQTRGPAQQWPWARCTACRCAEMRRSVAVRSMLWSWPAGRRTADAPFGRACKKTAAVGRSRGRAISHARGDVADGADVHPCFTDRSDGQLPLCIVQVVAAGRGP